MSNLTAVLSLSNMDNTFLHNALYSAHVKCVVSIKIRNYSLILTQNFFTTLFVDHYYKGFVESRARYLPRENRKFRMDNQTSVRAIPYLGSFRKHGLLFV